MQGKKNPSGSLSESIDFDSSPRDTKRISWGNIRTSVEKRSTQCEGGSHIMGGWCVGESSSSQNGPKQEQILPPRYNDRNVLLDPANVSESLNLNGISYQGSPNSDGFRRPCKRKIVEESVGSSSSMSRLEGNLWSNMNNLGISVSSQLSAPRADDNISLDRSEGISRRSRARVNPQFGGHSMNPGMLSIEFAAPRLQNQAVMDAFLASQQNGYVIWHGNAGASVTPSESEARNFFDNPFPMAAIGSSSVSRSTTDVGNSLQSRLPMPAWAPHCISSRSSSRLSEYLRRSLFPARSEQGTQSSVRVEAQPQRPFPRSGTNVAGIPYPIRSATNRGEGSSIPEHMRTALQMMRRGEGMRYEDLLLLDQSVFLAMIDRHRDMRLDVDNMSYEELLALEDRIGYVSTGLSEVNVLKSLKKMKYSDACEGEPCCICQEEYWEGEDVGSLDCGHVFHTECVKRWLMTKNWCPICKTTGLVT